ncbi:HEAT repeat protein [Teladorsagia circumcincta]|uniref:HEAT repeat protein n=1 Tax=Teladorsagia circumcincta TaxID=45464 RepID=A0A2G9UM95_TELCI|nr:HEAT repeat protein [Teladorsagia circumcincta]
MAPFVALVPRSCWAAPVPNGEAAIEKAKRTELNNNHLPHKEHHSSSPPILAKRMLWQNRGTSHEQEQASRLAKSEGNLIEEVENNPPVNFDDVPIKPAKGGQYFDGDFNELTNGTAGYGSLAKKSTSHHSLPVTATHSTLKHVKSTPVRKQQSTVKVLPSAQSKSPLPNKTQATPARSVQNLGPKTVANALKKIESDEWASKVEGINMISELSATNPKDVADHMHEVVVAILNECKNLRSSVSRVALACTGTLTQNMKGKMDMELDKLCMILINKAGDVSNAFIREDASEALTKVVNHASAGKALQAIITAGSKSGSIRKAVQRKLPDNVQLDLDEIRADLTAAGWERRLGGLKRFEEMCTNATKVVASDTKLIEAFIGRLNDINSKVSLEGLDTYMVTLTSLSKCVRPLLYSTEAHLKAVLNQLVLALMSHLSSKSDEHRKAAQKCLSETIKRVGLNAMLYPSKPKQVEVVALPILWECLKAGVADNDTKKAVAEFAKGLVDLMGERALLDQASMELDPTRRKALESLIR